MELIFLIISVLLLIIEVAMLIEITSLVKKYKDNTVEEFSDKLKPYLYILSVASALLAICVILITVLK